MDTSFRPEVGQKYCLESREDNKQKQPLTYSSSTPARGYDSGLVIKRLLQKQPVHIFDNFFFFFLILISVPSMLLAA